MITSTCTGRSRDWIDIVDLHPTLPDKFGDRIRLRLVDVASVEGFFKSLLRRFGRYPAFTVDGAHYVGGDFSRVDSLIAQALRGKEDHPATGPRTSTSH